MQYEDGVFDFAKWINVKQFAPPQLAVQVTWSRPTSMNVYSI